MSTSQFVQSRLNPPILLPLPNLQAASRPTLERRLFVLALLVRKYRPLDKIEAEEEAKIIRVLSGEVLRSKGQRELAEIQAELLA